MSSQPPPHLYDDFPTPGPSQPRHPAAHSAQDEFTTVHTPAQRSESSHVNTGGPHASSTRRLKRRAAPSAAFNDSAMASSQPRSVGLESPGLSSMNSQSARSRESGSATAHVDLAIHSASAAPSSATPGTSHTHSANQSLACVFTANDSTITPSQPRSADLESAGLSAVNIQTLQCESSSSATARVDLAIHQRPASAAVSTGSGNPGSSRSHSAKQPVLIPPEGLKSAILASESIQSTQAPSTDSETRGSSLPHIAVNRDYNVLNYSADPPFNASVKSKPKRPAPPTTSASATSPESSSSPASSSHPQSTSSPPTTVESSIPASQDDTQDTQDEQSAAKKPRIQLSADQPLTSHGKPRERVFVACVQCRTRKVRCDGGKPECFNCSRRTDLSTGPCSYDAAPRRRGKDRTPGSRKLAPYIPKKTRTTRSRLEEEAKRKKLESLERAASYDTSRSVSRQPEYLEGSRSVPIAHSDVPFDFTLDSILLQPSDFLLAPDLQSASSYGTAYEVAQDQDDSEPTEITTVPSVQFTRETWWDALLTLYAAPLDNLGQIPHMTVALRNSTAERVAADLRFLSRCPIHWYSFLNIPRFFAALFNPARRSAIQPSLILGLLGLATFNQSSELELGARGREKALRLIDQAHATFNASVNSGWIDVGLVQAAWILAVFEIHAHPKLSGPRTKEAMAMLDSLIRCLSLTTLDVDDPRASVFMPHAVPIVPSDTIAHAAGYDPRTRGALPYPPPAGYVPSPAPSAVATAGAAGPTQGVPPPAQKWHCGCQAYSLQYHWPSTQDLAPQWAHMPMWPKNVSEGEMQKEECRRLVWSALMLTATHNTKTTAGTDWEPQHLWIKDPANYALLFPGENLAPPGSLSIASSKDSVWALYMRALLLWHSCLRMRCDMSLCDADRAQYAMRAWLEIDRIEGMLDRHSCIVETGFVVQVREILFNVLSASVDSTRMCVSHEFQRYIPEATTAPGQLFYHDKATRFLGYQLGIARYFARCIRDPDAHANDHARRNFIIFWFMSQITRAIALWNADHTLMIALDVARTCADAAEHLMLIWPSPGQRREYEQLRERLVQTCLLAGVPPPPPVIGRTSAAMPPTRLM
ncbi:hypothetical protein FKP32DRAFT_1673551 [Trametes sanguinea]|nr:hypothetical protein FKP32DRAFT_1673551 [Trametes sanguinea]